MNDLTGERFGRLVVVGRGPDYINPNNGRHIVRWNCKCDCGGEALCQTPTLIHGKAKSCGCLARELSSKRLKGKPSIKRADLVGQRFGRLTVMYRNNENKRRHSSWHCKCDCGNETNVITSHLTSGVIQSCGCLGRDHRAESRTKHHKSHTRLYNVWNGMRQRCNDPNHKSYSNYGGRGIKVCDEWSEYSVFEKWALDNGYDVNAEYGICTLDRIDVNGNYSPDNCRWVDIPTQAKNKRNSK